MKFLKTFLIIISITGFHLKSHAQVSMQWSSFYNGSSNNDDVPVAMVIDNAGNTYVTGLSRAVNMGDDYLTVKYNSAGVEQWTARYHNPSGNDDRVRAITVDNSGNVYVTGAIGFGGANGIQVTIKYNSAGIEQWIRVFGEPVASPAAPGIYKSSIGTDASGNIYIGGYRRFGSTDNGGMLLIKYNSSGDSLWTRRYKGTQFLQGLGSSITCIKVVGNYIYVTGKTFDMNPNRIFATTIKYDSDGAVQWLSQDTMIYGSDDVIAMETDASGNVIVACNYGFDVMMLKYNSSGNLLWRKNYAGIGGNNYDRVTAMAIDASSNIYLTGNGVRAAGEDADYLTLKYDPNGNMLWENFYNGNRNVDDYSKGIALDVAGNVYVTGLTFELPFNDNYMTIKYNTAGVEQWRINYDGGFNNRHDEAVAIGIDVNEDVIVTGFAYRQNTQDDFATLKYSQTIGITQTSSNVPEGYSLSQNYPNPFNPATVIEFSISNTEFVSLKIYDMLGKEIAVPVNSTLSPGSYKYNFDASALSGGVYFYKLTAGDFSEVKKMSYVR
ncbi:MAG: SBBP repeat-containing protein [Ignavibacteria bacterium]